MYLRNLCGWNVLLPILTFWIWIIVSWHIKFFCHRSLILVLEHFEIQKLVEFRLLSPLISAPFFSSINFCRKKTSHWIPIKMDIFEEQHLTRTTLLEWRKSIDACCEDPREKIPTVRYPSLTYSLKYLPSYVTIFFQISGAKRIRRIELQL